MSSIERTKRVIGPSMSGLTKCLEFTVETEEDFADNWLPTLDLNIRVNEDNKIVYKFFEKPTASKVCLQADTALAQNSLVQSLVNDMIRRMANTSELVDEEEKRKIVDEYAQKMLNSGHKLEQVRSMVMSGLKGYEKKRRRCQAPGGGPFHRSAKESSRSRKLKKLTGKANWFRSKKSTENDSQKGRGSRCAKS